MQQSSDKYEDRIIPYIEGILNSDERNEMVLAIETDADLAREVSELEEMISDLREAFASGMRPSFSDLSVEDIVRLAAHEGGVESLQGSVFEKSRLFSSDQLLNEYHMLRALKEESRGQLLNQENIPPMPGALLQEFRSLEKPLIAPSKEEGASVIPLTNWGRIGAGLDKFHPRSLLAAAAAFALLTFGVHSFSRQDSTPTGSVVAFNDELQSDKNVEVEAPSLPGVVVESNQVTQPKQMIPAPKGIAVFTSSDKKLLDAQSQKLLEQKVRYTVTEDKILVSERHLTKAREVLWGEADKAVAFGENKPEVTEEIKEMKELSPRRLRRRKRVSAPSRPSLGEKATDEENLTPVQRYDYRSSARKRKVPVRQPRSSANSPRHTVSSYNDRSKQGVVQKPVLPVRRKPAPEKLSTELGDNSALRHDRALSRNTPQSTSPPEDSLDDSIGSGGEAKKQRPAVLDSAAEKRRQKLKDLALGNEAKSDSKVTLDVTDLEQSLPSESSEIEGDGSIGDESPEDLKLKRVPETRGGVVTSEPPGESSGQGPSDEDWENVELADSDVTPAPPRAPSSPRAPAPESLARKGTRPSSSRVSRPLPVQSRARPSAAARVASPQSYAKSDGERGSRARIADVRARQARVARHHNIVLSVESAGSRVRVYIRTKEELSKAELETLRRAVRDDLGLSAADSIIFR